jgi:hypothetical protein
MLSICMCLLAACQSTGYPPIENLLIDESVFPSGWSTSSDEPEPIARAPLGGTKSVESIEQTFYAYGGSAGERIRRFRTEQGAAEEFVRQTRIVFRDSEFNTPWMTLQELSYESPVADRFYCACSVDESQPLWPHCACIAQYEVYFVQVSTPMLPGLMTYADFEQILEAIDEKMAFTSDRVSE